ncbi:hypothetical protein CF166_34840 [Amycolatopsis sp. KNN50.9b]|nr:hypothetical protein CF166_34840 [Amycolatopsis sp. KNN50.9b]
MRGQVGGEQPVVQGGSAAAIRGHTRIRSARGTPAAASPPLAEVEDDPGQGGPRRADTSRRLTSSRPTSKTTCRTACAVASMSRRTSSRSRPATSCPGRRAATSLPDGLLQFQVGQCLLKGGAGRSRASGPLFGSVRALGHGLKGQMAGVLGVHRVLQQLLGHAQPVPPSRTAIGSVRAQRAVSRRDHPACPAGAPGRG